jgi:serine/threonine-protein kinase RsbW
MSKKHVLNVRGSYSNIRHVCEFVMAGAEEAGLNEGAIFHVELACDEACTNIIEHAYGGEDLGDIEVNWWVNSNNFTLSFHDNGRAFDPNSVPSPAITELSTTADLENLKVGGLGIHFMRTLMDEVEYSFHPQKGNTLVMKKQIDEKAE